MRASISTTGLLAVTVALFIIAFISCTPKPDAAAAATPKEIAYIIDTLMLFDPNTYEERVIIYQYPDTLLKSKKEPPFDVSLSNDAEEYSLDTTIVHYPGTKDQKATRIMVVKKKE